MTQKRTCVCVELSSPHLLPAPYLAYNPPGRRRTRLLSRWRWCCGCLPPVCHSRWFQPRATGSSTSTMFCCEKWHQDRVSMVDGWMDVWVDGWVGGWVGGWMKECATIVTVFSTVTRRSAIQPCAHTHSLTHSCLCMTCDLKRALFPVLCWACCSITKAALILRSSSHLLHPLPFRSLPAGGGLPGWAAAAAAPGLCAHRARRGAAATRCARHRLAAGRRVLRAAAAACGGPASCRHALHRQGRTCTAAMVGLGGICMRAGVEQQICSSV
jgi:hypothetical protein